MVEVVVLGPETAEGGVVGLADWSDLDALLGHVGEEEVLVD